MTPRIRLLLTFVAGGGVAALVAGLAGGVGSLAATRYEGLLLFTSVLDLVRVHYVEPVEEGRIVRGAVRSMLQELDPHSSFVEALKRRAEGAGLDHLIEARQGDMSALPFDPGTVHLIWCEGALYQIGFREGLGLWRPLLADGGIVAASEAVWTAEDPPAEVRKMWEQEYPAMTDAEGCIARAADAGYETLKHFTLPSGSWWTEYYGPLQDRVEKLRPRASGDPVLAEVLAETEVELDMHRRFGHTYSYEFLIMQKR